MTTNASLLALQHLYLHVPFCDGKCHYCGFYSGVADAAVRMEYATLPGRELRLRLLEVGAFSVKAPRTIYFGGGTPGMLGADGLQVLVAGLGKSISLADIEEWTIELNPTSVTQDLALRLRRIGVNRVSIGAQCFDDEVLSRIGRRNTVQDLLQAVATLRHAGFANIGLDLMAGLPGVSDDLWRASLAQAVALEVPHLSVYALNLEPGTQMALEVASGALEVPDVEAQLAALTVAEELLGGAGFARYEISNYARSGYECRHNLSTWRGEDYLGLGPSAASRCGGQRWTNQADLALYRQSLGNHQMPPHDLETLEPQADAEERFVFGMRLLEGVNPVSFAERYPVLAGRVAEWTATLMRLEREAIVVRTADGGWCLTTRGREVADAVVTELV